MANILTVQHIFSIVFLALAYFQFRFTRKYRKTIMKRGTDTPTTFGPAMMFGNYAAVVLLVVVAFSLSFGGLSH